MQTIPEAGAGTPAMARGGSGSASASGAATFRVTEGATLTLPDGCTATVRQGAFELSDGQRLPLPEAGGSVTIERRVVRPDGRAALVRHTIHVGETTMAKPAEGPAESETKKPADAKPAETEEPTGVEQAEVPVSASAESGEVPMETPVKGQGDAPKETAVEQTERDDKKPVQSDKETGIPAEVSTEVPTKVPAEVYRDASEETSTDAPDAVTDEVSVEVPAEVPSEVPTEEPIKAQTESPGDISEEVPKDLLDSAADKGCDEAPGEAPVEPPMQVPAQVPDDEPGGISKKSSTDSPDTVANKVSEKAPIEIPADVAAGAVSIQAPTQPEETPAEMLSEEKEGIAVEVKPGVEEETPAEVPSEERKEAQKVPEESPCELQVPKPAGVPVEVPKEPASENAEKTGEADVESIDGAPTTETADASRDALNSQAPTSVRESSPPMSNSLETPVLICTPEGSDDSKSALEAVEYFTSAPDQAACDETSREISNPERTPSRAKQPSVLEMDSVPTQGLDTKESPNSATEDDEPSSVSLPVQSSTESQPFCEWSESESALKLSNQNVHAEPATPESDYDSSKKEESKSSDLVKREDDDEEPVVKSRLVHHDSLRLPVHVPRLRRRSDGDYSPTDTHNPCGKKATAYLNDPQKRHKENEEMRTTLNSILHKLGYGNQHNAGDGAKKDPSQLPGGIEVVRPHRPDTANQDGPEEPEPVSVPKVISYFESISPHRVESPIERRKWRVDRSPSAHRSPRSSRSPEPSRDLESPSPRPHGKAQSPLTRRVNFADSAQVFIRSTSEPDEMEDIPIPRPEETSSTGPELVQICLKEVEPVITTQPARLTAVLVQNTPDKTSEAAEEPPGVSAPTTAIPQNIESPESQAKFESQNAEATPLSSSTADSDKPLSKTPEDSVTPDSKLRTDQSALEHDKSEAVTKSQPRAKEGTPEPEDIPDSTDTTPLLSASAAEQLSQTPPATDNANGGTTPIQAEPLPRPSSVIIQGDHPLNDFPNSRGVDPTDLPDGTDPALLTADGAEEAAGERPHDPFLPDDSAQRPGASAKPSTWFQDCLEICCCCWVP